MVSYNKEIQAVLNVGISESMTKHLYMSLVIEFDSICGDPEIPKFRKKIADIRKNERSFFREIIDKKCKLFKIDLDWRTVKFEPNRVKRCEVCGDLFYDVSRNGKSLTCYHKGTYKQFDMTNREYYYYHKNGNKLSVCAAEYEKRRNDREKPDFYPLDKPFSNEIPTDYQPERNDKRGHAFLEEIYSKGKKV